MIALPKAALAVEPLFPFYEIDEHARKFGREHAYGIALTEQLKRERQRGFRLKLLEPQRWLMHERASGQTAKQPYK